MTYINQVFLGTSENMDQIPDGVVDTCVTSPPYFRLRDYEHEGQIGCEDSVPAYIDRMVAVFEEVKRVLKPEGTVWLNIGDAYAGSWGAQGRNGQMSGRSVISARQVAAAQRNKSLTGIIRGEGLKPKDLMGMPWRVAFALQEAGWWLRSDVIWHKPNAMPSSVNDRCTSSHEYVFMLTKSKSYFYDVNGVREPYDPEKDHAPGKNSRMFVDRDPAPEHKTESEIARKQKRKQDALGKNTYTGFNDRWKERKAAGIGAQLRDVWSISTEGYPGEHFAVMPREMVRRCILLGSPEDGLVLDPFMGSGTVAEVAIGCGRKFVGYELNPDYCSLIRDRLGLFGEGVA